MILVEPSPGWAASLADPGAYAIVFTDDLGSIEGRRAGLELRDTLLVLSSERCRYAFLFRVPLAEPTVADQLAKTRNSALNINGCRISGVKQATAGRRTIKWGVGEGGSSYVLGTGAVWTTDGRWPPNVLLVHGRDCRDMGTKRVLATSIHGKFTAIRRTGVHSEAGGHQTIGREQPVTGYADAEGLETIAAWSCGSTCPVKILDDQTGERPSTLTGRADPTKIHGNPGDNHGSSLFGGGNSHVYADSGGGSRFYPQFKDDEELFAWLQRLIQSP